MSSSSEPGEVPGVAHPGSWDVVIQEAKEETESDDADEVELYARRERERQEEAAKESANIGEHLESKWARNVSHNTYPYDQKDDLDASCR